MAENPNSSSDWRIVVRFLTILLLLKLSGSPSPAALPEQPGVGPTTAPADNEISSLIAKLGDAEFHVRRDALNRLREIGPAAAPALKQAANSPNPDIRSRAAQLIHSFEHHPLPGRPRNANNGALNQMVRTSIINGRRQTEINDNGRQIKIEQNEDGITMTVTGELDGEPATETYKASSPERLEADNPEAYALFKQCTQDGPMGQVRLIGPNGPMVGQAQVFIMPQGGGQVMVMPPANFVIPNGGDDLEALRLKIHKDMADAKLPVADKIKVLRAMNKVDSTRLQNQIDQSDARVKQYDQACDELRKALKELNLPDPGAALPPPQGARLGVSVQSDVLTGGMSISHVMPDSRASKIGIHEGDVIRKINGTDVTDVKDLRRLVTEHGKGLELDITRDGKEMKLQEK
jgi:hypothetical protein